MDIPKTSSKPDQSTLPANFNDYFQRYLDFDWQYARDQIRGYGDGINMAYEAIDRHVEEGYKDQLALIFIGEKGQRETYSYGQMQQQSDRFANVLSGLGIKKGQLLCSLSDRVPILYTAILGCLKTGVVFSPLSSAFGPEPILSRMEIGKARVLLTSAKYYQKKVAAWRHELSHLDHVLLYDCKGNCPDDCIDIDVAMAQQNQQYKICQTSSQDTALLYFTSGTTGQPKGVVHVHEAVVYHKYSGFCALDIKPNDVYWCTADPGWVTGISYGVIAPLCNRATLIINHGKFDPSRWYSIIEQEKVNVWYTAPTAIRLLMKVGEELAEQYDLSSLRFLASVGEPLNPEAVVWSERVLGKPFHENWWQTETGGIMLANFRSEKIKAGSMGRPLPGISAGIVQVSDSGRLIQLIAANEIGELALRPDWPSMFRDYLHETKRYKACFKNNWYLSGDLAYRDEDGYYWFVGRSSNFD